jgi:hypothetical protein
MASSSFVIAHRANGIMDVSVLPLANWNMGVRSDYGRKTVILGK